MLREIFVISTLSSKTNTFLTLAISDTTAKTVAFRDAFMDTDLRPLSSWPTAPQPRISILLEYPII
ncbi:hypothetical protein [Sphingobacterium spiritivorum]|uniref:hypothetical protein n=1 Tax=Sphingobacterium spiritivorum TaxID=258 RepID=UPI003DA27ACC